MPRTEPFDELSGYYDDWFERFGPVYESELAAIRAVIPPGAQGVEIGVGSGRFAPPLGISDGVEPSEEMARRARARGLSVYTGTAEQLPLPDDRYDFALMVTTICFIDDPDKAVEEMLRVIRKEGLIILAFVDRDTPLGRTYEMHKSEDPFYRHATFYSTGEVLTLVGRHGLSLIDARQTVYGHLDEITAPQEPQPGYGNGAFVVLVLRREG